MSRTDRSRYSGHDLLAAFVHHVHQIVGHCREAHAIAQQLGLERAAIPEERALLDLIRRCAQMKTTPITDPITPEEAP